MRGSVGNTWNMREGFRGLREGWSSFERVEGWCKGTWTEGGTILFTRTNPFGRGRVSNE